MICTKSNKFGAPNPNHEASTGEHFLFRGLTELSQSIKSIKSHLIRHSTQITIGSVQKAAAIDISILQYCQYICTLHFFVIYSEAI